MKKTKLPTMYFIFNDTATTEIYTLSLHDALPISTASAPGPERSPGPHGCAGGDRRGRDRKSTRLNSSHEWSTYAVVCWKKKSELLAEVAVVAQTAVIAGRTPALGGG